MTIFIVFIFCGVFGIIVIHTKQKPTLIVYLSIYVFIIQSSSLTSFRMITRNVTDVSVELYKNIYYLLINIYIRCKRIADTHAYICMQSFVYNCKPQLGIDLHGYYARVTCISGAWKTAMKQVLLRRHLIRFDVCGIFQSCVNSSLLLTLTPQLSWVIWFAIRLWLKAELNVCFGRSILWLNRVYFLFRWVEFSSTT